MPQSTITRILVIAAALASIYLLWHVRLHGAVAIVPGIAGILLGRMGLKSGLYKNPFGENRDFAVWPAAADGLKAVGLFSVAMLWAALLATAVHTRFLPDSAFVAYGATLVPIALLIAVGAWYLLKGILRLIFGQKRASIVNTNAA